MKAKFIGDPDNDFDGPKVLRLFGRQFPKDRFVTISAIGLETEKDVARVLAKLSGNNHFEVGDGEGDAVEIAAPDPLDHDRNGKKGGSRAKKDIVADLEALADKYPGEIEFDPKATGPSLSSYLEEKRFELGED